MASKKFAIYLPVQDTLEAKRKQLPVFEPYETGKLLADAAKANNGKASDAAIAVAYERHCHAQMVQLLVALGCDPDDELFWPKSFMKLARIYHNLGRVVHRLRSSAANAASWTPADESVLLFGVNALVQTGLSEREAVRTIADAKVFPHHERRSGQRLSGQATRLARELALWRKYQRLRQRSKGSDPIARQLGMDVSDFEMLLIGLGLPAPSASPRVTGPAHANRLLASHPARDARPCTQASRKRG
jgi:hypothetical protein